MSAEHADLERLLDDRLAELADVIVDRVVAELEAREARRASAVPVRRPDPSSPLVDTAAAARWLSVAEPWVRANAGRLRVRRLSRSTMRFDLAELDELLLRGGDDG